MESNESSKVISYIDEDGINLNPKEIGERIRNARKNLNMTQEELAAMLNISYSYISCLEAGSRNLTHQITMPLLRALNISYEYLFTGSSIRGPGRISALCESTSYYERLKLELLIQNCTKAEYEMCYELCHTYLKTSRLRKKRSSSPEADKNPESDGDEYHISE